MLALVLASDPFSILTVVVAPAVLTNSSSVLALGTNNRLARVADRAHSVATELAKTEPGSKHFAFLQSRLPALKARAQLLLRALRCFYLALGLFASSAVVAIAGSIALSFGAQSLLHAAAAIGFTCGACAVAFMAYGSTLMIRETRLAVAGIEHEAVEVQ